MQRDNSTIPQALREYLNKNIGNDVTIQFPKAEYVGKLVNVSDNYEWVTVLWDSRPGKPETIEADRVIYEPSRRTRSRVQTSFMVAEEKATTRKKARQTKERAVKETRGKARVSTLNEDEGAEDDVDDDEDFDNRTEDAEKSKKKRRGRPKSALHVNEHSDRRNVAAAHGLSTKETHNQTSSAFYMNERPVLAERHRDDTNGGGNKGHRSYECPSKGVADISRIPSNTNLNEHAVNLERQQDDMIAQQKEEGKQGIASPKDYPIADDSTVSFELDEKESNHDLNEHLEEEIDEMEWLIDDSDSGQREKSIIDNNLHQYSDTMEQPKDDAIVHRQIDDLNEHPATNDDSNAVSMDNMNEHPAIVDPSKDDADCNQETKNDLNAQLSSTILPPSMCQKPSSFPAPDRKPSITPDVMVSSNVVDFFCFMRDLFILAKMSGHRNSSDCTKMLLIKPSEAQRLKLPLNIYRESTLSSQYFQQQVKLIIAPTASHSIASTPGSPYSQVNSESGTSIIQEYNEPSSAILADILFASLCFRSFDSLFAFEAFGCIPRKENWRSFHIYLRSDPRVTNITYRTTTDDEQVSYPQYIAIMSSLLQNECELLVSMVAKLITASAQGDLPACYSILCRSIPSLSPYVAWEVICDLLEVRVLGLCTEDMHIPYIHPSAKTALETVFGSAEPQTPDKLIILLHKYQNPVFEKSSIQYDGKIVSLKNMERALRFYGIYLRG